MGALAILRGWFRRLVQRPAELLEVFSSATTLALVAIAWWNLGGERVIPSISLMAQVMPEECWFVLAGLGALLQLLALRLNNPDDPRHPVLRAASWGRWISAGVVGTWYAVLCAALGAQLGLNHIHAMYGGFLLMNAYIVAHVLTRDRG